MGIDFAGYEEVFTVDVGLTNGLAHLGFVAVHWGCVEMTVAHLNCVEHRLDALFALEEVGAQADLGD